MSNDVKTYEKKRFVVCVNGTNMKTLVMVGCVFAIEATTVLIGQRPKILVNNGKQDRGGYIWIPLI
jgi:hypothetical protein